MDLGGCFATLARMRKRYPTDLSGAEWECIEPHLPLPRGHGRPRTHDFREILNAIFYLLKSGCQWRLLPHDFPRWPTVYWYFRKWRIDGTWVHINRAIRERLRVRLQRDPQPSAGVVDSQSVKSTAVGGEERGYDGGKKVKRGVSATSWWTPRVSCSRRTSTAPMCWTKRASSVVGSCGEAIPSPFAPVVGRGLPRRGQGRGLGTQSPGLERRSRRAPQKARLGKGADGVGCGVGQGGREGRLAKVVATQRLSGTTSSVGGGADAVMDRPAKEDEPMDYERLCASGEALVYAAMIRLMTRRLARV